MILKYRTAFSSNQTNECVLARLYLHLVFFRGESDPKLGLHRGRWSAFWYLKGKLLQQCGEDEKNFHASETLAETRAFSDSERCHIIGIDEFRLRFIQKSLRIKAVRVREQLGILENGVNLR
jgi:hypothetical protein